MDDGVDLAATLYEPSNAPPPAGYPAIVLFHGIGGKRQDLAAIAQSFDDDFAVLAFDARGHGQSGGLVSIDGPREIADTREVYDQLAARPEIDKTRIGAWGISLGGGAVLRSLVQGVPWKTVETVETWTDLYSALAPQNLTKSGAIFQFLGSVPADRLDPTVTAIRDDALTSRNLAALRDWTAVRSSRKLLKTVTTPVFMFQGRRDFAFDIAQAKAGYALLKGPKRLYVGDFGHSPSTFPGPDFAQMMQLGKAWFTRYLGTATTTIAPITLAPSPWRGKLRTFARLPSTRRLSIALPGNDHLAGAGRARAHERALHRQRRDLRRRDRPADRAPDRRLVAPGRSPGRRAAQGLRDRRQRGRHQHDRPDRQPQADDSADRHRDADPARRAADADPGCELGRAESRATCST